MSSSQSPIFDAAVTKTLQGRIDAYKEIERYLKQIKSDACLIPTADKQYMINDSLLLFKKIGSESSFGVTYVAKALQKELPHLACKIQINHKSAKLETYLLNKLTKYAISNKNFHLPLIYKSVTCKSIPRDDERFPKLLAYADKKDKSYTMVFNEIANGDFKRFIHKRNITPELWKNAIEQIYMCIATVHSLGILHLDSHYGNFLYHKIVPGGCFHYVINGNHFYIPNMGYLWVIWDFGVSGPIYRNMDYVQDYNLFNLFIRKDNEAMLTPRFKSKFKMNLNDVDAKGRTTKIGTSHRRYGNVSDSIEIPGIIQELERYLWKNTGEDDFVHREVVNKKINEADWLKKIMEDGKLFSNEPIGAVVATINLDFQTFNQLLLDRSSFVISDIPKSYL